MGEVGDAAPTDEAAMAVALEEAAAAAAHGDVPVGAVVCGDADSLDALADGRARLERWPGRRHAVALRELAAEVSA